MVAGEATARSSTSKIILIVGLIRIYLLEARMSILLSSKTVFKFSIQMASTGPSKIIHWLSGVSDSALFLIKLVATPSIHSLVLLSYSS